MSPAPVRSSLNPWLSECLPSFIGTWRRCSFPTSVPFPPYWSSLWNSFSCQLPHLTVLVFLRWQSPPGGTLRSWAGSPGPQPGNSVDDWPWFLPNSSLPQSLDSALSQLFFWTWAKHKWSSLLQAAGQLAVEKSSGEMLLSTSAAERHGVWSFQSGRSEACDVIMGHSNLATSLNENTSNCQTYVCTCPRDQGKMVSPATDPTSARPPKPPSRCPDPSLPLPSRCAVLSLLDSPPRSRSFSTAWWESGERDKET